MFEKNYIPTKPFADFKWKWACLQCTEGLNDPVVLLGVLFRMRKLEGRGLKYSSQEFANELIELSNDVSDSIGVDLARRTGERNLIRNSGQYWRAVGLIPPGDRSGEIRLTEYGRRVADRDISQTEFSAITIQTFKLPNAQIQNNAECLQWESHSLVLYPLRILLSIIFELNKTGEGYITTQELTRIVIPLSGVHAQLEDYVNFIHWYRAGEISVANWPNCCEGANDFRIAREFLLFLSNYGYLNCVTGDTRENEQYHLNTDIIAEIAEILNTPITDTSLQNVLAQIRNADVASEVERKRIQSYRTSRPNQARFRTAVLEVCQRCVITNVTMPEVLEAAHIKPFKYKGEDTVANGFAMRTDIHILFDSGHLRISEDGIVELSNRARMDYGATIPPRIVIPDFINRDFIRWRWDNYNGI
ncbi:MAG: AlwI family type II restriction endonuclease [Clostridia bacterium]|nr:AlwI family type II restriction endonuclease [Clostridia bacterium]